MDTEPKDKKVHFEVFDFKGNRIVCYEDRWIDHIIANRRHANMDGLEDLVVAALQKPFSGMRYHDTVFVNRMSYYGDGAITRYIKVSVEFKDGMCTGEGVIKTAFPTNNMKPQEKPEWIK